MTLRYRDILAIDPGTSLSAYVMLSAKGRIVYKSKCSNEKVLGVLNDARELTTDIIAIELMQSYGNPVGKTVFETCYWIGRFIQAVDGQYIPVYRKDVAKYFLPEKKKDRPFKSTDANIRAKLIGMYPEKDLVGFKADMWSALAIGRYVLDTNLQVSVGGK